ILYNVPSRTGCNIKPETYLELSKTENIVAAKEANGDISSVAETMALCGDNLQIYSGNDDQTIPILSLGGKGVISVFSNICPAEMHHITSLWFEGKLEESRALFLKWLDLMNALFIDVNPIPIKEAANQMGFEAGSCRLPLTNMGEGAHARLLSVMKGHGLIG
ncbi:MAG: dihydrodipicolinate synthase family protein, partial [Firmicutes bacterium]|nr:dihydrodipicolinate synthase family protein [Bacillota bacterium]